MISKFSSWGVKQRRLDEYNYNAIWSNLQTIRLGKGSAKELPPEYSEFYDIGINTRCNCECEWCYVSATSKGEDYEDICETWIKWMSTYEEEQIGNVTRTLKPLQIAIGSTGEPTLHKDFCKFLETVYSTGVVPNYTTNGLILSLWDNPESPYYYLANKILDATSKYVGGVAISFGNKLIRNHARNAIAGLMARGNCYINIHHIISNKESVDDFINIWKEYGDSIKYHVLLPLMQSGRSTESIEEGVFEYLESKILENNIENVAFGAHFIDYLKDSKIESWIYEPESFSKNIILKRNTVYITPSSFNLTPIKTINL